MDHFRILVDGVEEWDKNREKSLIINFDARVPDVSSYSFPGITFTQFHYSHVL